uniref:Protein SRG1 n=1 Tax=Cajanus cajan TaxID=3821 RepID=A0A151SQW9_CAJCA|nr:Protein SRG1 [Cajanus cajan]
MEEFFNPSGTSLLVPSVQELAKHNLSKVPQRYIQPQQHEEIVVISKEVNGDLEIPVIDMHKLLSQEFGSSELDKFHLACKEWGFFQLINHGVSSSFLDKLKLEIEDFFNLPITQECPTYFHNSLFHLVEGLQIKKDGMWVPVIPLPNAFVVNVGDILEIITNGIYRSIEHRATVNSEKERVSIATFYSPRHDAVIGPWPSLITKQTPPQFKRIQTMEYFKNFFARKLEGKAYRDALRIEHHD